MIIYVHGFASSGNTPKADALREAFPNERVETPTLPFDPFESLRILDELITDGFQKGEKRFVVVGTSLGGFYALNLAATRDVIAVVANPAINAPRDVYEKFLGINTNFATGETFFVTTQHVLELEAIKGQTDELLNMANVYTLVALDDELLNVPEMQEFGRASKDYTETSTGGHRFDSQFHHVISSTALALNDIHVPSA